MLFYESARRFNAVKMIQVKLTHYEKKEVR